MACTFWLGVAGLAVGALAANSMVFQHLSSEDGLSQDTVMSELQDAQGFLWFATEDGLDRYDGYTIRRFGRERQNGPGLASNFVWSIHSDRRGDLWLALKDGGVGRFDPRSETVRHYRHLPNDPNSLASDAVRQLLIDRDGKVWVGTSDAGISVLDPDSGRAVHFRHTAQAGSLSSDAVTALAEDAAGRIWIGTDHGLNLWEPKTQSFRDFEHRDGEATSIASDHVSTIFADRGRRLWVGSFDAGLSALDLNTFNLSELDGRAPAFSHYSANVKVASALSNPDVRAILEDSDGRLWVGTVNGLNLLNPNADGFSHFAHDASDPTSLSDNYVMSLYQDRGGILWVGTRGGGVSRWNPRSLLLGHRSPDWLAGRYPVAFADDTAGRLWVGTIGAGLFRFDPRTGAAESFDQAMGARHLLPDARVMALLRDHDGELWIGTMTKGLLRASRDGQPHAFDAKLIGADGVMSLLEARNHSIWVGTFGGGVAIIDHRSNAVQRLSNDPAGRRGLASPRATALAQSPDGVVWIGTDGGGLSAYREDGSFIATWRHDARRLGSLAADTVYAVHIDVTGRVWIGTDGGGMNLLRGSVEDPDQVSFENFSTANGLPSNVIYGIRSDRLGALWASTNRGLVRYDPQTRAIRLFHREHGLQGEDFNSGAHFALSNGWLAFGGPNGFNLFDPLAVMATPVIKPAIALTAVDLSGTPAKVDGPIDQLSQITLDYRDRVASFEFAALDFTSPKKNQYAYRLRGFDEYWNAVGLTRRATYTNLDAGSYDLEVKAANADGYWSDPQVKLHVVVTPAPWRTKAAYTFYAAIILVLLWSWQAAQRRKLVQKTRLAEQLEREVAARTAELKQQNVQLVRLSKAKSDFLARMSHEIRTPMNGLIGMAELLATSKLNPQQSKLTATLMTSARSLMRILNDVLDISKVEAGHMTLESVPFDLADLMADCAELFVGQASSKGIDLSISPAVDLTRKIVGDPLRLTQVLLNLLGNAIKFTPAGEISLRAKLMARTDERVDLALIVSDTGIGMAEKVHEQIFQPFVQEDESTTRRFGGTGLGLTICRELVQLMGGTIGVQSERFIGSVFTVRLSFTLGAAIECKPQLQDRSTLIVSRWPRLSEGAQNTCRLLGLKPTCVSPDTATVVDTLRSRRPEFVIVDIDSCHQEAIDCAAAVAESLPNSTLVLIGYPTSLAELSASFMGPRIMSTPKPLRASALQELLIAGPLPDSAVESLLLQAAPPPLRGHLMVAEDNVVNAQVIEGMLEVLGCSCRLVANGREAVEAAISGSFDAILMDVHMPDIDGFAATTLIRRTHNSSKRTPIIALTASSAGEQRQRCLEIGMDDFICKPTSLQDLRRVLARWLPETQSTQSKLTQQVDARERNPSPPIDHRAALLNRVAGTLAEQCTQYLTALRQAVEQQEWTDVQAICLHLRAAAAASSASHAASPSASPSATPSIATLAGPSPQLSSESASSAGRKEA